MKHLREAYRLQPIRDALLSSRLTFVDVGAAVGVEEPWLSMVADRELTRVVAFEPNRENYESIARLANGRYYCMAVSDRSGSHRFYLDGTLSSLVDRSKEAGRVLEYEDVDVDTLANLRASGVIPSLDVIKTDAELADFAVIKGAGDYLRQETLAIQCEFSAHGSGGERPFRDYDALLQPHGFKLFGLSYYRGSEGEIGGGNFLYLRSVFDIVRRDDALPKVRGAKLIAIALALSKLDAAYVASRALGDAGIFSDGEVNALLGYLRRWVYVPDAQPFSHWRVRAASALGNLTAAAAGGFSRGVSVPASNRLENYRKLVIRSSAAFSSRKATALYESDYQIAKASQYQEK